MVLIPIAVTQQPRLVRPPWWQTPPIASILLQKIRRDSGPFKSLRTHGLRKHLPLATTGDDGNLPWFSPRAAHGWRWMDIVSSLSFFVGPVVCGEHASRTRYISMHTVRVHLLDLARDPGKGGVKKKTEAQDVAAIRPARRTKLRRQCCSGLEIAAGNGRRRVARTSTIEEQGTRKSASFRRHVVGLMPASIKTARYLWYVQ